MEPTMWTEILTRIIVTLVAALGLYLTLMAPVVVRKVTAWIDAKRGEAEDGVAQEKREARQDRIEQIATMAVGATMQTYVSALKAGAEDGKLQPAERKEAFAKAITTVRKHLLEEGIDAASEILEDYIEEAVARLK